MQPTDVVNLTLESIMSVELESFRASPSKKYQLQTIPRQYFIKKPLECVKDVILSRYVTDADREHNTVAIIHGSVIQKNRAEQFNRRSRFSNDP